jgi:hypothetical protein
MHNGVRRLIAQDLGVTAFAVFSCFAAHRSALAALHSPLCLRGSAIAVPLLQFRYCSSAFAVPPLQFRLCSSALPTGSLAKQR